MVSQWQFEPGVRDCAPSEFKVNVPFQFYAPFDQQVNAVFNRKVFLILPEPTLAPKEFSGKLKVKKEAKPEFPPSLAGSKIDEKIKVDFVVAPPPTPLPSRTESPSTSRQRPRFDSWKKRGGVRAAATGGFRAQPAAPGRPREPGSPTGRRPLARRGLEKLFNRVACRASA